MPSQNLSVARTRGRALARRKPRTAQEECERAERKARVKKTVVSCFVLSLPVYGAVTRLLFHVHWAIDTAVAAAAFLAAVWLARVQDREKWDERVRRHGLRFGLDQIARLHHRQFEILVRDLMRRDGFTAEQVGGAGDNACDVRGVDPDGRIWSVQCKHSRRGRGGTTVRVHVLQQVKGTAGPVHRAHFAVVVTNGRFTANAVEWGAAYGVHLIDSAKLDQWAAGGQPLWELVDGSRPRRHPADLTRG
ncbi:restriction endonuclease [Kitasatospora sp. NBC_00240]|uniref:restriction endonuclease n=1 Tax=Kitasatospora sp. NBC_00240 TaxID=2903567 RepID=UPI002257E975|nr:restriction endonuclease [Kitasatospora sp. NBC_00240]MCX5215727.1 restriction endonuclease [Kitasatospora sp. NBC_00240]